MRAIVLIIGLALSFIVPAHAQKSADTLRVAYGVPENGRSVATGTDATT